MYPSPSMSMPKQYNFSKLLSVGYVSDLPDSAFTHRSPTRLSSGITEVVEY